MFRKKSYLARYHLTNSQCRLT